MGYWVYMSCEEQLEAIVRWYAIYWHLGELSDYGSAAGKLSSGAQQCQIKFVGAVWHKTSSVRTFSGISWHPGGSNRLLSWKGTSGLSEGWTGLLSQCTPRSLSCGPLRNCSESCMGCHRYVKVTCKTRKISTCQCLAEPRCALGGLSCWGIWETPLGSGDLVSGRSKKHLAAGRTKAVSRSSPMAEGFLRRPYMKANVLKLVKKLATKPFDF